MNIECRSKTFEILRFGVLRFDCSALSLPLAAGAGGSHSLNEPALPD